MSQKFPDKIERLQQLLGQYAVQVAEMARTIRGGHKWHEAKERREAANAEIDFMFQELLNRIAEQESACVCRLFRPASPIEEHTPNTGASK